MMACLIHKDPKECARTYYTACKLTSQDGTLIEDAPVDDDKSFLRFIEKTPAPKTKRISVENKSGDELGMLHWHGPWRKYVFEIEGIIFDENCLDEISAKLKELREERKKNLDAPAQKSL